MRLTLSHLVYPKAGLYAKGRIKSGELNCTESSYAQYLDEERRAGRVADFWFESLKLRIADGACWYCPDFMVLRPDGQIELHEVKGSPKIFLDDAKIKCKACATQYPFALFVVYPRRKKDGGGFDVIPYP